ncbi:MAG: hypothetical protein HY747_07435 [Elusimicrobia bacterium]|nr:hypothetical protein [Elusimicrobiota bacterium]
MKKLILLVGLILGWLFAALIPPPPWLIKEIKDVFRSGKERVGGAIDEQTQVLDDKIRDKVKDSAIDLQKAIEKK